MKVPIHLLALRYMPHHLRYLEITCLLGVGWVLLPLMHPESTILLFMVNMESIIFGD